MVSNFCFILLKLLLVFLGRQINWLKSGWKTSVVQIISTRANTSSSSIEIAMCKLIEAMMIIIVSIGSFRRIGTLLFHLHEYFDGGLYIIQNRKTVKLQKTFPLLFELFLAESVNLKIVAKLRINT